jgi:hypothetical protein
MHKLLRRRETEPNAETKTDTFKVYETPPPMSPLGGAFALIQSCSIGAGGALQ